MRCVLHDQQLLELLGDDVPFDDLTTQLLIHKNTHIQMDFSARYAMTLCGVEEAARMLTLSGAQVEILHPSGSELNAEDGILTACGPGHVVFSVWKSAQVLIEWASGIASAAAAMVANAQGIPITCTRKQVPNTKALSVKAVRSGGAQMHRLGTSESILVFAEHRQYLSMTPAQTVEHLRRHAPKDRAVFEVHDVQDALVWAKAGAELLQLDKFSLADIKHCKAQLMGLGLTPQLGIAGGVTPSNVADYAAAGADSIVTSYPYYAKPKDVEVVFH